MKNRIHIITVLFLALLCRCGTNSNIETKNSIRGKVVYNSNGSPLDSALVHIAGSESSVYTDSKGRFEISAVELDTFSIVFSRYGFRNYTLNNWSKEMLLTKTIYIQMHPNYHGNDSVCPVCYKADLIIPIVPKTKENQKLENDGLVRIDRGMTSVAPVHWYCKRDKIEY